MTTFRRSVSSLVALVAFSGVLAACQEDTVAPPSTVEEVSAIDQTRGASLRALDRDIAWLSSLLMRSDAPRIAAGATWQATVEPEEVLARLVAHREQLSQRLAVTQTQGVSHSSAAASSDIIVNGASTINATGLPPNSRQVIYYAYTSCSGNDCSTGSLVCGGRMHMVQVTGAGVKTLDVEHTYGQFAQHCSGSYMTVVDGLAQSASLSTRHTIEVWFMFEYEKFSSTSKSV